TFFLDLIFVYISFFILGAVLHAIGLDALLAGRGYGFGIVVIVLYYTLQEAFWGRTLGKAIAGTKVMKVDGSPISFGQALVRSICRFIPFEALSFLGGHGHPVGWHDKIAKTKVVSVSNQ
ncbi:MAG TPA: RDD family protein, partial [Anaerolineales bacterium]|nr:RDD family protein [Anaerolineales bacterium]